MIRRQRILRTDNHIRSLVRETKVSKDSLILPIFVKDGINIKNPISSLENQFQYSVDTVCKDLEKHLNNGLTKFILFGVPDKKDEVGSEAYDENGIVNRALTHIKKEFDNDIYLISDVCMCEYTSHGHCGILKGESVLNDETVSYLEKIALSNVYAGADMIAPSDMMDGRIKGLRNSLENAGFYDIPIMAYSVKYASCFYNPFRDAANSAPSFGDRKSYQMDYHNSTEALREIALDYEEGADIIMVKPALSYLDIISKVKQNTTLPVSAYSVSGEYAMIKAAHKMNYLDEYKTMCETTTSIFRAGADILITYFAPEIVTAIEKGDI